mmetsp:Transcript_32497/g.40802  ORF Transcript_32497/g.40802 Transcript_32497/m.40802 type:complete len:332 (+) Transcript_32497:40-1035(+)
MPEIFKESLNRRYYASYFSCAYLFYLSLLVIILLVPFFLAYSSHDFWLKENQYREQAYVKYKYKYLLLLQGSRPKSEAQDELEAFQIFHSSVAAANTLYSDLLRIPVARSQEKDSNYDGVVDVIKLSIEMPLATGEEIYSVHFIPFFQYYLREYANIEMETMAFIHHQSTIPGKAFYTDGDLEIQQRWPFSVRGGYNTLYEDTPLLDPTVVLSAKDLLFSSIIENYRSRNYTTNLISNYPVWEMALVGATSDYPSMFNLTTVIRIPISRISYTPNITEVLKDAWIQYLSMAVVVAFLLQRICSFVFYYQVVETDMTVETAQSRKGIKLHAA